jgi:Ca2+-binding RTX toxin-like protein
MATLTATVPVDMTDWDFDIIKAGTVELHGTSKYQIVGANGLHYQFVGTGLTYDGSNLLTAGTITGYRVLDSGGHTILSVSGFTLGASTLETQIQSSDAGGAFENAVFASTNNIGGSAFDDVLQGLSSANETISGGDGNDIIIDPSAGDSELGTQDKIFGGNGDDTVFVGSKWVGASVDGGEGYDTVIFNGDYGILLGISAFSFSNDEAFVLLGGPTYTFSLQDDLVGAGQTFRIDASQMGASAKVFLDAHSETDGSYEMLGSAGNDELRAGAGDDTFWLDKGGKDKVYGGAGADTFIFGGSFNSQDRVHGNAGTDVLKLDGNYNLSITGSMLSGVEQISLAGGHSYTLTLADDSVAGAGIETDFLGYQLGSGNTMTIDGSAELDGRLGFVDGGGNDSLTGGAGNDTFLLSKGGTNIINGGGGDDLIEYAGNYFTAAETISGGAGNDTLFILQDLSSGLTLGATTLSSIEAIQVGDGQDYDITFVDANVAAGQTMTLNATLLTDDFGARFDGSAELDGRFVMMGGAGSDTLIGGAKVDTFTGGGGADVLTGGAANDTFVYAAAADSTSKLYDSITDFNGTNEFIDVTGAVTGRDADIVGGTLSRATFDTDLAAKVDAAHLLAGHAVFFKATAGTLNGHTFLVIDQNGTAGYQSGGDIVIDMTGIAHQVDVSTATFI